MNDTTIINRGFEADWGEEKSHRCLILPVDGTAYEKPIGNIFTPPGWVTWFRHKPGAWDQPEVTDMHRANYPERVRSGERSMRFFTFNRAHDGGFFQQVTTKSGTKIRLSAWAHAWSNHPITGHDDCTGNGLCSVGVGKGPFFRLTDETPNEDRPGLSTGDPWADAVPNFTFWVGIDPTGGTNPTASTVIWGQGAHIYNVFARVPAVEAIAKTSTITVFLRSKTKWKFRHNDAYWDDAELVATGDTTPPSPPEVCISHSPQNPVVGDVLTIVARSQAGLTNVKLTICMPSCDFLPVGPVSIGRDGAWHLWMYTTDPLPGPGAYSIVFTADDASATASVVCLPAPPRGLPRVQYERTYLLLPSNADAAWAKAAIAVTWDKYRITIGSSADDAGVGNLDVRRVITVNPAAWGPGEDGSGLLGFFKKYYDGPGKTDIVHVDVIDAATPAEMVVKLSRLLNADPVLLGQADDPWGSMRTNGGRCGTFASAGCWLTDCAMALRFLGIDVQATPLSVDRALSPADFSDCSMRWDAMPKIGLQVTDSTMDAVRVKAHLAAGGVAFAEVLPGPGKHFVLVTREIGWDWDMYDPLERAYGMLHEHYGTVESWRLIGPAVKSRPTSAHIGINDPNDQGAGRWMADDGMKGILYIPLAIDYGRPGLDFTDLAAKGINVYVNLRFSWANADGGQGTLPSFREQVRFETACQNVIYHSKGVVGWSLTNEANSPREWPRKPDGSLESITPARLATFFDRVAESMPIGTRLSIGGFDPFNVQSGMDPREWMRTVWNYVKRKPDYVDVHGYIRGPDASLIDSDAKFPATGQLGWQYLNYPGCITTLLDVLPAWAKKLPVICTEFNHLWKTVEPDWGWVSDQRAYDVITKAHEAARRSGFQGLVVYRWTGDAWATQGNEFVRKAVSELGK